MATEPSIITAQDLGHGGLQLLVTAGPARFVADQPAGLGGLNLGPTPHDLVCAGLAACTAQTLRLYAQRKTWALGPVTITVSHHRDMTVSPHDVFTRSIAMDGDLDDTQRARLLEIAEMCPVHRMLIAGARVDTALAANPI